MADPLLAQMQEVEALQAIYGDDFTERPGVWNRPAFAIHIHPPGLEEGVTAHVVLTVKVRIEHHVKSIVERSLLIRLIAHTCTLWPQYTQAYPKTPPMLELSERRGFPEAEEQELLELLKQRSQELAGDVMVFDLILIAGRWLGFWLGAPRCRCGVLRTRLDVAPAHVSSITCVVCYAS